MTAGAIDNVLASLDEIDLLKSRFPQFSTYLGSMWALPINRTHYIPFGAGISIDGVQRYLSNDVDFTVLNRVDCGPATADHESSEFGAIYYAFVGPYENDVGHRIGNRMEYLRVSKLLYWLQPTEAWKVYNEHIEPQIVVEERMADKLLAQVPKDLALYPYVGTPIYEKLLEITGQQRPRETK